MNENLIPHVIHYCWFGKNPLSEMAKMCIDSWKKYCPDYIIKEWNERNFDINCCNYVKEAYEAGKWAFVSDVVRFKILFDYGGLYFDTDVELIKPIDHILSQGGFMGVESYTEDDGENIAPGLGIAAPAGLELYREILEEYYSQHFKNEDGSLNLKTVVEYTTECLKRHGLRREAEIQKVGEIDIYPKEYFNPYDFDTGKFLITDKTVSIHHYAASWVDHYSRFRGKVYNFLYQVFGENITESVRKVVGRKPQR